MVAGKIPNSISEYAYTGAMIGQKIPIVRGEVTGLPIPAAAEIVVEGWIRPDRLLQRARSANGRATTGVAASRLVLEIERLYFRTIQSSLEHRRGSRPTTTRTCARS